MASGRLVDYLGFGLAAARPTSLSLNTGTVGIYFSTDTVTVSYWNGSSWQSPSGSGNMTTTVYDPANIEQQVVGTTAVQTVTHKDLTDASNSFPTFNQNTTGSAAKLTTARAINGVNFDGSAPITVPSLQLVGINDQTGTTYTLVLADAGKDVRCTNASAIALTVPLNSSVAFPIGTMIPFSQGGAGAVTATAASGVTVNAANGSATTAQYDARVLEKVGTDTWRVW